MTDLAARDEQGTKAKETSVQTDRVGEDTIAVIDSLRSRIEELEGMLKKQMDEHTADLAATRQNVLRETEDAIAMALSLVRITS